MTVEDRDREVAESVTTAWETAGTGYGDLDERIAEAIAAERERVLARIRALAEELRREAPHQEAWDGDVVLAYRDIADRIIQAAASVASPADQPEGSQ